MAEVRRCSDCGNEILGWAEGVCYVCGRNKRTYQRRNGLITHQRPKRYRTLSQGEIKRSRIVQWTIREGYKRDRKPVTKKSIRYSISTSDLEPCREGFHNLIREVFGEGLHFCQLLKDLGYPSEKVDRWRDCEDWMCTFLRRFEKNLCDLMRRTFPDINRNLLTHCYGLASVSPEECADPSIAFGKSKEELQREVDRILEFMQSDVGRHAMKILVLSAVHEGEGSRQ